MHVVHLAEALDPTRFTTRLITGRITEDEGDMTYYARDRGVEVTEIEGMSRLLSPPRDLRSFLTLLRIFRRERPSIVHTHTAKAGTLGRLAAIVASVPVIVTRITGTPSGGSIFPDSRQHSSFGSSGNWPGPPIAWWSSRILKPVRWPRGCASRRPTGSRSFRLA